MRRNGALIQNVSCYFLAGPSFNLLIYFLFIYHCHHYCVVIVFVFISTQVHPRQKVISCKCKTPIIIAIDVTGSMGTWAKVVFDKAPMFFGTSEETERIE